MTETAAPKLPSKMQSGAAFSLRPPAELSPLTSVIGEAATLQLLERYGGLRIKVPVRARAESALAGVIGLEALARLTDVFGGSYVYVPLCKYWMARLLRMRDGLTHSQIARKLNVSEESVRRYLLPTRAAEQDRLPGL